MNVNWQNLITTIKHGQSAHDGAGFGNPVESGSLDYYDIAVSDFSDHSAEMSRNNPKVFVYGFSKWGQGDKIIK